LSNVARHARAKNVLLKLDVDEDAALQLLVADDGQGFDVKTAASGMGLENVRQRVEALAGQLEMSSQPDAGTSIRVSIPLQDSLQMKETRMNKPDHLFNKVAIIGLLGGIALNLLLIYPLIVALPDVIVPPKPTDSPFLAGLLGLTAVPLTMGIGYLAARYAEIGTRRGNRLVGAIAGSIATFIFYLGY
ncbi:MAG: hypothetical protein GY805_17795, partial [Chloroflexi bacterium]|nr:hypothetical protein [Chloroflexota bacterium]